MSYTERERLNLLYSGQYSYHSEFALPKIVQKGEVILTSTTGATIVHNLGFIPFVKIWCETLTGEITIPPTVAAFTTYHSAYTTTEIPIYYTDTTQLVFSPLALMSSLKVYYRIYR